MRELLGDKAWIPLSVICVLGVVLRLIGFDAVWVSPDEGIYYSMVTWDSWADFYAEYAGNAHPPLYYVVIRLVGGILPEVWALRSVALIFGCAWIPATYLFVRECTGRDARATLAGLLAALLIAISYTAVEMSQLMRPYTMQISTLTFAMYYLVRFVHRGGRGALPAYAALMSIAALTHYSTILVCGGIAIAGTVLLALKRVTGRQLGAAALWSLPVLAVLCGEYLLHIKPSLVGSELETGTLEGWLSPLMINSVTQSWTQSLAMLSSAFWPKYEGPAAIVFLAGVAWALWRRRFDVAVFALAILAVAIAAAAAHRYPFGFSRHSLYLATFLVGPIGFGLASAFLGGRRTAALTLVALVALIVFRQPVSLGLGSPGIIRAKESRLLRTDFAGLRPMIDDVKQTPGLLLMSTQAFCQMMPLFHPERQDAKFSANKSVRVFPWGLRTVVVPAQWAFSIDDRLVEDPRFLLNVLDDVDRDMPELRITQQTKVVIFIGGWSSFRKSIATWYKNPSARKELIHRLANVPGFTSVDFHVANFVKRTRQWLEKHR